MGPLRALTQEYVNLTCSLGRKLSPPFNKWDAGERNCEGEFVRAKKAVWCFWKGLVSMLVEGVMELVRVDST